MPVEFINSIPSPNPRTNVQEPRLPNESEAAAHLGEDAAPSPGAIAALARLLSEPDAGGPVPDQRDGGGEHQRGEPEGFSPLKLAIVGNSYSGEPSAIAAAIKAFALAPSLIVTGNGLRGSSLPSTHSMEKAAMLWAVDNGVPVKVVANTGFTATGHTRNENVERNKAMAEGADALLVVMTATSLVSDETVDAILRFYHAKKAVMFYRTPPEKIFASYRKEKKKLHKRKADRAANAH